MWTVYITILFSFLVKIIIMLQIINFMFQSTFSFMHLLTCGMDINCIPVGIVPMGDGLRCMSDDKINLTAE